VQEESRETVASAMWQAGAQNVILTTLS
jgi:hypothetical protein